MIVEIGGYPDNIVAVQAEGQVTGEDYSGTLVPAVERTLARHDKVRFLYQIGPDFKRFTTTALWEDAKIGLHHLDGFERIAVVTDVGWIRKLVGSIDGSIPGKMRTFALDDVEAARTWIQE
ncbi:MAG: STAS/SEC14 domain-containing protein [Gammaproteobacteria bacterium]|nr:STAS/SEC14 domain-containing protein [Gammaproteobacteria bacterium]NND36808.1 STAS/SEC14 domain-containing protein [Gammaproteobacteria bacterium]